MTSAMHIALNVDDLDQSRQFYEDLLGHAPDKVKPGYVRFNVADPALVLSLNTEKKVKHGNQVSHLGIRVDSGSTLKDANQRLRASGHELKEELGIVCCHARQDKFWVKDPDGNSWEFYIVTDDMQPAAAGEKSEGGCCG